MSHFNLEKSFESTVIACFTDSSVKNHQKKPKNQRRSRYDSTVFSRFKKNLLFCITALLSGCHLDNQTPALSTTLAQFPSAIASGTGPYHITNNITHIAWWRQFNDPQLNELIVKGLQNNLEVHIALDNLERAKGQLEEVQLGWIPMLSIIAGYSTNPSLGVPGAFYGVLPYYAINIAKQLKEQQLAKINIEYRQAVIDGIRLLVIGQVASSYFTLMAQTEQLRLLIQLDKDLKQLVQLSRQNIKIGLENNIDLASFLINEQQALAQLTIVRHNLVVSQNALRYLINENPGKMKSQSHFNLIDFTRFKPGSLPSTVLQNRPDMAMATYALKQSGVEVSIGYADFFPLVQLDEFLGQAKNARQSLASFSDSYLAWKLDPSTLGKIRALKGAKKARMDEYIKTVRTILRDVDNDFSANDHFTAYYIATQKAEKSYKDQYLLQKGLLKAGLISYNMLLINKITLDNLALTTNQAKLQLAMTLVLLYQDLAGGYKVDWR